MARDGLDFFRSAVGGASCIAGVANSTVAAVVPAGAGGETTTLRDADTKLDLEPEADLTRFVTEILPDDEPDCELGESGGLCVIEEALLEVLMSLFNRTRCQNDSVHKIRKNLLVARVVAKMVQMC